MQPNFRAAALVLVAALYGACASRALPNSAADGAGLGGTGVTTGGAGAGGSAGPLVIPDCPPSATTGKPCAAVGSFCYSTLCSACSDQYWRLVPQGPAPCVCDSTGVWMCPSGASGGPIGDCFFDPPLDCALAQSLYEDATCLTHPPCSP